MRDRRSAAVMEADADFIVRTGWNALRLLAGEWRAF